MKLPHEMRVLVTQSLPDATERMSEVLAVAGWDISRAHSAAEALDICGDTSPDVLVVSAELAPDVVARVKTDPDLYTSAIVVVGSTATAEEALAALDQGVHTYVGERWTPGELLGAVRSAGRMKLAQEELLSQSRVLEELIYADSLTGLYNRRFLHRELAALVAAARRHQRDLSVVLVDVDHFKTVNDTLGHLAGDRVLREVASRLASRLRASDYLGRFGGEEFLALLPDTAPADAAVVAEALRSAIESAPVPADGATVAVTVSAGWATWSGQTPEELVDLADQALYRAKRDGRNCVRGALPTRSPQRS
jgi:two-component system cell cycle response regulator